MISCRKCGKVCRKGNGGLCDSCRASYHAAGNGSAEYTRNRAIVASAVRRFWADGIPVVCVLCGSQIDVGASFHVDHIVRLRDGGSNRLDNLRPTHAHCNLKSG